MTISIYNNYEKMLGRGVFNGTIILQNDSMVYYWSPFRWYSPEHGLSVQPENWCNVGQSTFWADEKMKSDFLKLKEILGDNMPMSPNEYYDYHDGE